MQPGNLIPIVTIFSIGAPFLYIVLGVLDEAAGRVGEGSARGVSSGVSPSLIYNY